MKSNIKLIKVVKKNNFEKAQCLLAPESSVKNGGAIIDRFMDLESRESITHVNVNCVDTETGYRPLMWAVLNGNRDMVAILIHFCADVNAIDRKGNTALHLAAFVGRSDMIDMLLARKVQIDVTNDDGNTALHIACQNCNINNTKFVLSKLLKASPNVFIKNKNGLTAFELAAQFAKLEAVALLLDHEFKLSEMTRALVETAVRGHWGVLELMLNHGMKPNLRDEETGNVALNEACRYLRYEAAEVLISYGADPDVRNSKDETARLIVSMYSADKSERFIRMFDSWKSRPKLSPKYVFNGETDIVVFRKKLDDLGISEEVEAEVNRDKNHNSLILNPTGDNSSGNASSAVQIRHSGAESQSSSERSVHSIDESILKYHSSTDTLPSAQDIAGCVKDLSDCAIKRLEWLVHPVKHVMVEEKLPDFSVQSHPECTEELELIVECFDVIGKNTMSLSSQGPEEPSVCTFSNVSMLFEGKYNIVVRSVKNDDVFVTSTLRVDPKPQKLDLNDTFDELEKLLQF